jgi:mannose-6-phosphate isomerase-like protein (cupin superfamily)
MDPQRSLHVVHLLIRDLIRDQSGWPVGFLVYPHDKWPYLTLPAKKTVKEEPFADFRRGSSLEHFLEAILKEDLEIGPEDYALEQEIEPAERTMKSPHSGEETHYTIYPLDVWVRPSCREPLRQRVKGRWLTPQEALGEPSLSPTAQAVFELIQKREQDLEEKYRLHPEMEQQPGAPRRLLHDVADRPTMDALALKWLSRNRGGVRYLSQRDLNAILDAGQRAFNLRVADPYLRYQMQGVGFTWSFFTHKDPQDLHVHGAPVVEIYGVLEGELEVWWKPYHDRGTSAWCQQVLKVGDWLEVDSLQCHIVTWRSKEGKGVVFKAGPGPLAEVGRLGVTGKTRCTDCQCMLPREVKFLCQSPFTCQS